MTRARSELSSPSFGGLGELSSVMQVCVDHGHLPPELVLQRTTEEFTEESLPAGLLRSHKIAAGVWGLLRVIEGRLRFVWEQPDAGSPLDLAEGDSVVIPPGTPHRVDPDASCRFVVELHA